MDLIFVFLIVIFGSILTFFSGFGLGTLLLPVFLLFFNAQEAILAVAIVHFFNSIFKFIYVRKHIVTNVLIKFGIPAIGAALLGSYLLSSLSVFPHFFSYELFGSHIEIHYMEFVIGFLIILFTWLESSSLFSSLKIDSKYYYLGGFLSGFFGGLSGHQGALRSLFLKKSNLSKEELIGTSNAISLVIDLARISMYLWMFSINSLTEHKNNYLILIGIIGALIGVQIGNRLLKKITMKFLQRIISICLFLFGLALMLGLL